MFEWKRRRWPRLPKWKISFTDDQIESIQIIIDQIIGENTKARAIRGLIVGILIALSQMNSGEESQSPQSQTKHVEQK